LTTSTCGPAPPTQPDLPLRLVKKHSKKSSKELQFDPKVEQGLAEVTKSVRSLHEVEKAAVRRVLVEERSRYCTFVACLKPVLGEPDLKKGGSST